MAKMVKESASIAYFDQGVDEPGYYLLEGDQEKDDNGVVHETNMTPGKRVYPSGEWFSYDEPAPEEVEEGGEG